MRFCCRIRDSFPDHFKNKRVLDVGSMNINGDNRYLFTDCEYTGLDIGEGRNVDVVMPVHIFTGDYDTVISTEMLEHDVHWRESLLAMLKLAGEFLIFTCAGPGRAEHGTTRTSPDDSPFTNDYYRNISPYDIKTVIDTSIFSDFLLDTHGGDTYFFGKLAGNQDVT